MEPISIGAALALVVLIGKISYKAYEKYQESKLHEALEQAGEKVVDTGSKIIEKTIKIAEKVEDVSEEYDRINKPVESAKKLHNNIKEAKTYISKKLGGNQTDSEEGESEEKTVDINTVNGAVAIKGEQETTGHNDAIRQSFNISQTINDTKTSIKFEVSSDGADATKAQEAQAKFMLAVMIQYMTYCEHLAAMQPQGEHETYNDNVSALGHVNDNMLAVAA